jgi:poly-beta-hydroxyalkanoate depolymerase
VFVIPAEGVDKALFIKGLEEFNNTDTDAQLTISEAPVDEFRNAVIIGGLADRETAARYSRMVVQNRSLYEPLGNASYRNFLISTGNFDVFLKEKNITDYMDFYKQIYLNQ